MAGVAGGISVRLVDSVSDLRGPARSCEIVMRTSVSNLEPPLGWAPTPACLPASTLSTTRMGAERALASAATEALLGACLDLM
jgi:hypothetical protein